MMDVLTPHERSGVMRKIKSRGTKPELALAALLAAMKLRCQAQPAGVPGKPDFLLKRARMLIFMDGCFWHGCPACCRMPADHRDYWTAKIERNAQRDARFTRQLRRQGWSVLRVWEHELKDLPALRGRIARALKTRRRALARKRGDN